MSDDRIEGAVRKGVGRAKEAVGSLVGDSRTQAEGRFDQASGSVQDLVGPARERAADLSGEIAGYAKEQPIAALAVTLGVGLLMGLVLSGGRKTVYVRK